jgi:hypothetical protein
MFSRFGGLLDKVFFILLAALAAIALSLFTIFNFLPSSQLNQPMGLALFIVVTCLLLAGYTLGFAALAFVGIFTLTRLWQRSKK